MDPHALIEPAVDVPYPAPFWFLQLFKVLGFTLHLVPMNLWLAGTMLAMLLHLLGGGYVKRLSARLMKQMPIIVAFGVNFGIVPLLFLQVVYYRVFYPATILMAWPWLAIILLLTVAYYGVYIYVVGLRDNGARMTPVKRLFGWLAAILFLGISFLFANGFSLMTNVDAWPQLWQGTSVAGAPLGTALNVGDATLWPRWLMMFGLALTTVGAYVAFDTAFFAGRENDEYRRVARRLAFGVYTLGAVWFAAAGSWYVFGTWRGEVYDLMFAPPWLVLTILTAAAPALPWLLILIQRGVTGRGLALLTGLAQFVVLGLNAVSRQVVQNAELSNFLDLSAVDVRTQWSPLLVFLALFVIGLAIVIWMISKAATARPATAGPGN